MEHDCPQCGAPVEDGRPFCAQCHAPQIHVSVRPPTAPVTEPLPPGTPEDAQPPAQPMVAPRPGRQTQPGASPGQRIDRRAALGAAVLAGALAAVGSAFGVVLLALLCMFAAGGLAVTLYRRRTGYPTLSAWMGAKVGIFAGGWGFGVLAFVNLMQLFSGGHRSEMHKTLGEMMREQVSAAPDDATRQMMQGLTNFMASDHGMAVFVALGLLCLGLCFVVVAGLGGALGATLFGRDDRRQE